MQIAFWIDEQLSPLKDSSIAMMQAAVQRGHSVSFFHGHSVSWQAQQVFAQCHQGIPRKNLAHPLGWFELRQTSTRALSEFDVILIRKDPPFDSEYAYTTMLLETAQRQGCKIYNPPQTLRLYNEKIAITRFSKWIAPTLISSRFDEIDAFLATHQKVVLKPLDGMGGRGIFVTHMQDPNRRVIVETLTDNQNTLIMAQQYLPQISAGDRRILIAGNRIIPNALARIPQGLDPRGNLAAGGKGVAQPLTAQEQKLAEDILPTLQQDGLFLVGLDVIGGYLTEVNVTSPTCLVEIHQQSGLNVADIVIEALETVTSQTV